MNYNVKGKLNTEKRNIATSVELKSGNLNCKVQDSVLEHGKYLS